MNMKHIKFLLIITFFVLPALYGFAGGVSDPAVTVADVPEGSRLVLINWENIKQPQNYRWGLYRFNLEEKTYVLVSEIDSRQSSYLDEEIELPVSNYFYKVEHVDLNANLPIDKPIRLRRRDVEAQHSTIGKEVTAWDSTLMSVNATTPHRPPGQSSARYSAINEGIYVGIISFSGKVTDITQHPNGTPALVPLDAPGRQVLLEYLNLNYVSSETSGSALYYADHKAIANLTAMEKEGTLPANLDSVNIITFTDGSDTSSTDSEFTPIEGRDFRRKGTSASYRTYISQQLSTRRIGGAKINAWAIGIQDKDVENSLEFSQTLEAVASDSTHIAEFPVISQMEKGLTDIADGLNIYTPRMNLTFSTPAYPLNTMLRLTFDSKITSADTSEYYVDARVAWDSTANCYVLNLLASNGITLPETRRIEGKRNDTGVSYVVTVNNDFDESNVRLWYIQPDGESSNWRPNNVVRMGKTADFTHERKSAVVYLVLDCGLSLTPTEIDAIRAAMTAFINKLYEISASEIQLATIEDYYPQKITPVHQTVAQQYGTVPTAPPTSQRYGQDRPVPQADSAPNTRRQPIDPRVTQQQTRSNITPLSPPPVTKTSRTPPPTTRPKPDNKQTSRTPPSTVTGQSGPQRLQSEITRKFYWVQLGSFTDVARAQHAWGAFAKAGMGRAEIFSYNINGTIHYRVKVGPYTDKKVADESLARIKSYSPEYRTSFITND
jgi:cell division septation protein DedD